MVGRSKVTQTSFPPATLSSSSWGFPRPFQLSCIIQPACSGSILGPPITWLCLGKQMLHPPQLILFSQTYMQTKYRLQPVDSPPGSHDLNAFQSRKQFPFLVTWPWPAELGSALKFYQHLLCIVCNMNIWKDLVEWPLMEIYSYTSFTYCEV